MKKYIYICLAALIAVLIGTIVILGLSYKKANNNYKVSYANILAYQLENSSLKDSNIQFEYTINQLNFSKDSLIRKLDDTRRELKVKDRELLALGYLKSDFGRSDTVYIHSVDTVDRIINAQVDTTVGDKWFSTKIKLTPPNEMIVTPSVTSEKSIITKQSKIVSRPSKCKFVNFFRKKIKVVEINVVESNPYIVNKEERFIEVVK